LKNQRTTITLLLGLILVLNGATLIGAYAKQRDSAGDPSDQRIVRLMDLQPGERKEGGSAEQIADGSNDEAIRSLLDKKCEVAVASRKMRRDEIKEAEKRGLEIKETVAGWVGIAVAVHPTNPINELTADQVRKVVAGEYASWNEVGGVRQPISIAKAGQYQSASNEDFAREFLKARLRQMPALTKHLSEEPNAVALIRFEETGIETHIKILAIKKDEQSQAILPSRETVDCGTYPFRHPLYASVDWKNATDATKAFFSFLASQTGRTPCK
jgi:phosphate transport system substrate-binding protein